MYHLAEGELWTYTSGISSTIHSIAINRQMTFHPSTTSPSLVERTKNQRAKTGNRGDTNEEDEEDVNNYWNQSESTDGWFKDESREFTILTQLVQKQNVP